MDNSTIYTLAVFGGAFVVGLGISAAMLLRRVRVDDPYETSPWRDM